MNNVPRREEPEPSEDFEDFKEPRQLRYPDIGLAAMTEADSAFWKTRLRNIRRDHPEEFEENRRMLEEERRNTGLHDQAFLFHYLDNTWPGDAHLELSQGQNGTALGWKTQRSLKTLFDDGDELFDNRPSVSLSNCKLIAVSAVDLYRRLLGEQDLNFKRFDEHPELKIAKQRIEAIGGPFPKEGHFHQMLEQFLAADALAQDRLLIPLYASMHGSFVDGLENRGPQAGTARKVVHQDEVKRVMDPLFPHIFEGVPEELWPERFRKNNSGNRNNPRQQRKAKPDTL